MLDHTWYLQHLRVQMGVPHQARDRGWWHWKTMFESHPLCPAGSEMNISMLMKPDSTKRLREYIADLQTHIFIDIWFLNRTISSSISSTNKERNRTHSPQLLLDRWRFGCFCPSLSTTSTTSITFPRLRATAWLLVRHWGSWRLRSCAGTGVELRTQGIGWWILIQLIQLIQPTRRIQWIQIGIWLIHQLAVAFPQDFHGQCFHQLIMVGQHQHQLHPGKGTIQSHSHQIQPYMCVTDPNKLCEKSSL